MKHSKNLFIFAAAMAMIGLVSCKNEMDLNVNNTFLGETEIQITKDVGKVVYVKNVNKEIAGYAAATFLSSIKGISEESKIAKLDSIVDMDGKTAMYIINFNPTGFVFTSADVRNEPIVAYSQEDNFFLTEEDGLPDALKNKLIETIIGNKWLQDSTNIRGNDELLRNILQNNVDGWFTFQRQGRGINTNQLNYYLDPILVGDWIPGINPCDSKKLVGETTNTYGYYCQTTWGQGQPYNYFAPSHYPAGCVAVAVGQIMKFHQYPSSFNWSIMPNYCTSTYSSILTEELEIARLLRDIGVKVNMDYTTDGSYAYSTSARYALVNNYNYSSSAKLEDYNYNKVVNEIKTSNHPIYAVGDGTRWSWDWWLLCWHTVYEYKDGHAYVIDGYQENIKKYYNECSNSYFNRTTEFLHYNFGWGGLYNGWFSTSIIDVVNTDIDWDLIQQTYFPNFQYKKMCIYNIIKP